MGPERHRPEPDRKRAGIFRRLMVIPVPFVFVIAYLLGVCAEFLFLGKRSGPSQAWIAGDVLYALGAALAGWAWMIFHRARTTKIPGQTSTTLVTWGPYRLTRNPMYIGLSLVYLGEAGLLRQILPAAFLPLVIAYLNWVVIPVEEGKLEEAFGDQFRKYRSTVRRWL